ncbi:4-(cytidine 5'-diphospho)-2-C-methyl-D-erythritol kinase [Desulfovibrio oxyclinae]|uniref:4-(cytidine 5'-diphospho)-2-C-methyl-D-erythritol kinase n=1 Tax=Desulfovibrio oxyclinae TaxID=63560 RepID=UPI00035F4A24|nr:4-(cytidine 5'-diphospho)-2-C-methyl-D-erythritol kinase [Desulfovibrio oxyclinae]
MNVTLTAPCKVNLTLELLDLREDGYHELRTLFLPVPLPCDELRIEPAAEFSLSCPGHEDIEGPDNLVHRAWAAYGEAGGPAPAMHVTLNKGIPMGAGLGGGSTDAAALLRWLEQNAQNNGLGEDRLHRVATRLGADVPFFLDGVPAWAEGIGERLTKAETDLSGTYLLVANPGIHVNTGWAYGEWDRTCLPAKRKTGQPLTSANDDNKNSTPAAHLIVANDFEEPVFRAHPAIRKIKELFFREGARAAAMSGSGSSVFALFRTEKAMKRAAELARAKGCGVWENML